MSQEIEISEYHRQELKPNVNKTINKNINRFNRDEYYDELKVKMSEYEASVKLREIEAKQEKDRMDNIVYLLVFCALMFLLLLTWIL